MLPVPVKVAPTISPPAPALSDRISSFKVSPAVSRSTTFTAALGKEYPGPSHYVSGGSPILATEGYTYVAPRNPTPLSSPAGIPSSVWDDTSHVDLLRNQTPPGSKGAVSIASTSNSRQSIKEVAPWIDYELTHLTLPTTGELALTKRSTIRNHFTPDQPDSPTPASPKSNRKNTGDGYTTLLHPKSSMHDPKPGMDLRTRESSKSILTRSRNPVAKLFDGTDDEASAAIDSFPLRRPRAASAISKRTVIASRRRERASSTGDTSQPVAPVPIKYVSPSPLLFERRDAVFFPDGHATSPFDRSLGPLSHDQSPEDSPTQAVHTACTGPFFTSLKDFIASRAVATACVSPTSSSRQVRKDVHYHGSYGDVSSIRTQTTPRPQDSVSEVDELSIEVAFRDPFQSPHHKHDRMRAQSRDVSPQTIV